VKPDFHLVPAAPGHADCGAGGTSVTEISFLVPVAFTATIKLSGIAPRAALLGANATLFMEVRRGGFALGRHYTQPNPDT
jgi:hypothetical protein